MAKYLFQYHLCNRWCRLITAIHRWHWWCCNILALLRRNVIFKILICHVCNNQGLLHRNIGFKILKNPLSIPFSKLLCYKDPDLDEVFYFFYLYQCSHIKVPRFRPWVRVKVSDSGVWDWCGPICKPCLILILTPQSGWKWKFCFLIFCGVAATLKYKQADTLCFTAKSTINRIHIVSPGHYRIVLE